MPTLAETFAKLSLTRQKRSILEHVVNHLENEFVERDEGEPPQTMQVDEGGERVSQEAFTEVVEMISDRLIGELQVEEARLGSAKVSLPEEKKVVKKATKAKKAPPKPAKKAPPKPKGKSDG